MIISYHIALIFSMITSVRHTVVADANSGENGIFLAVGIACLYSYDTAAKMFGWRSNWTWLPHLVKPTARHS